MRRRRAALIVAALGLLLAVLPAGPAQAQEQITGGGSTFSKIAIEEWRKDVNLRQGLQVIYQANGSSQGRNQFKAGLFDYASSDIAFEPQELPVGRDFTYLPMVAGGTALMYNLNDTGGRKITNLQLSGPTIARIFTGEIRKWDDAAVKADNPGLANRLPAQDIKAVVRSGGSGTSAVFTGYMANQAPDVWARFAATYGIPGNFTSTYPDVPGFVKQSGSDGITAFVANPNAGKGSIGYAEAGYAIQAGLPVAYVRNASGNWTLPTARNVAVALLEARRNPDGTQDLGAVYGNQRPETYAISSYNYLIVPTSNLSAGKGLTLGRFVVYSVTEGQAKSARLGYSPLPPNLVQQALDAVKLIPGAEPPPPLGDWGRYYEQLDVQKPVNQGGGPQQGGGAGGGGGGAAGGGGAGGAGGGAGGAGGGAGGPGGAGAVDPATGEALDEAAAELTELAALAAPGANLLNEAGGAVYDAGEAPTARLLLTGVALAALFFAPPLIARLRRRTAEP